MNDGYKRCKCRDENQRELGAKCPRLHRADGSWSPSHGTWYGKTDVAPAPDGSRVTLRAGGFASQREMSAWFDAALALLAIPESGPDGHAARAEILGLIRESRQKRAPLPDADDIRRRYTEGASFRPGTAGEYLLSWLAQNESAESWSASTLRDYRQIVRRLFLPEFGRVPLDKLRSRHILAMLASIDEENERIRAAKASPDPAVRAAVAGRRPVGPASKRRYVAVIRSALADAMDPSRKLITANPAAGIKVGKGGRKAIVKARLWTPAREQAWREQYEAMLDASGSRLRSAAFALWRNMSLRPSPVMVWMPEHLGRFLDAVEKDRLYSLFCVTAHCGLRRGEAVGLPWSETDLDGTAITISTQITQAGWEPVTGEPKTEASAGTVRLDDISTSALRAWRRTQLTERIGWGAAWRDTGLVWTREDGSAYHPAYVTSRFERLAFSAGLPPVGFHALRHGAAVLALAAGVEMKVISAMLRHSSVQITSDIYADVLPDLAAETAAKVASMVPRKATRDAAV